MDRKVVRSFQTSDNLKLISIMEDINNSKFISEEAFKGVENNHKFKIDQVVELTGLVNYPQFNGEKVKITSIREDGKYGKAYYFSTDNTDLSDQLNWVYEYRLKKI